MKKNSYLPKGLKSKLIALLAAGLLWSGLTQAQNLVVTLTNLNIKRFAQASIQSIKFGAEEPILCE